VGRIASISELKKLLDPHQSIEEGFNAPLVSGALRELPVFRSARNVRLVNLQDFAGILDGKLIGPGEISKTLLPAP
jgi:hypothetical protein